MRHKKFVLDSYAILALVEDEPGAQVVADILSDEDTELYLSVVNLGEVYYIISRKQGERAAEEVVRAIMEEETVAIVEVSWPRAREAARIKAKGGLSYADAFVLGLAVELKAPVVTGDPEIKAIAESLGAKIVWVGG
ncbi:PIN domain nuclease, a component of toxin-antitoxin system (PIN domain) [Thermanaeromonas toyohensis ToBE]|uniref:Ribonuclease VapC n=1 Tax=Thermanaeromonas toyohensis ToBE TaxID=698762 RepID=A0A1W1VIZ5_9FIRM|nr:type II toxin-antitoxin system VapC family toxin [Thermanaeromonas toyohensis]SMB93200.1 PIN domain nuclease, a component of toxin-antitoxin system (PIN domain) [Thermanaeromonas toyohensis ToBE]